MASNESGNSAEVRAEQADLKRKLVWRMGFAGLMIVILLGTLVLFDYLSSPDDPASSTPESSQPIPVSRKEVTQPVKIAEQPLEIGKDVKVAAEPEGSSAPIDKSSPLAEAPPRPQVSAQPVLPRVEAKAEAKAETKAVVKPDSRLDSRPDPRVGARLPQRSEVRNAPLSSAPSLPTVQPTPPAPQQSPPQMPRALPAQAAPPVARREDYPEVARPQPSPPRLFSGFALQAGVFADLHRAEELHAKLTLHGIPSTFEARVNVGPFKTREEADAAREKMKTLGIDSVMLLPKGIRR